jgi:hypothetical protein
MKTTIQNIITYMLHVNKGKIFTITFKKKDGTLRKLNGRLGVHFGKKLSKPTTSNHYKYIVVYDMQKQAYRNVNMDTIQSLTMLSKHFEVKG